MKIRPPIKKHGGKYYLSKWIIEHFPENYETYDYVEPFLGGGSVFLNKQPVIKDKIEVIGDTDLGTIQIFRALRDEPKHFLSRIKNTTYSEVVFKRECNKKEFDDYMDQALNAIILSRMSRGGLKEAFAWSVRQRGGEPGDVHAWKTMHEQLKIIAERLKKTYILHQNALNVISAFDSPTTLFYCDPPYVPDTRISPNVYGENEMSTDDHIALANLLLKSKGKIIISGYPCTLYNRLYKQWRCTTKTIANHSSQQKIKQKKIEACWMNF